MRLVPRLLGLAGIVAAIAVAAPVQAQEVEQGTGALLRGLDKVNAQVSNLEIANGGEKMFGRLSVRLQECRYPKDDPAGDAYAYLSIMDSARGEEVFSGWMLASSPALNALEHPRYDVWVLRCTTE